MSKPRIIDVSAGLVFRAGQLLITQRPAGTHLGGLWEFPGGKREPEESDEACLRRELLEELGIEVRVEELVEELVHEYPDKAVRLRFFRCSLTGGEPQPLQCSAFAWVRQSELTSYAFPAADQRLLARLGAESTWWNAAIS